MEGNTRGEDETENYKRLISVDVDEAMKHVFEVFTSDGQYKSDDLKNVYLFGSRLYGVATPDADYDLICIVEGEYFHGSKQLEETRALQHAAKLEVTLNLYHIQFFRGLLERNMINSLMCLCMPRECAWLERWPLPSIGDVLRVPALQKAVLMDSSHNLAKAKAPPASQSRLWFEGDTRKSKKNIVHGLRYLHYALQLADSGAITDYTAGNSYWRDIMSSNSENWDDYEKVYKPIYQTMMHQLKHNYGPGLSLPSPSEVDFVDSGEDALASADGGGSAGGLLTLDYIRRKGIQSLVKDLAIAVTPHPDFSAGTALLHLSPNPTTSPSDHPIVRECAYSMLIEEAERPAGEAAKGDQVRRDWRVVAMGYKKIDYLIEPFTLTINFPRTKADDDSSSGSTAGKTAYGSFCWDKNEMRLFEKLDGKMALMYHYAGEWRVASASTPDASEPVVEEMALSKRTFKDWLTSITLNDEAEELAKRAHRAEEELRLKQREYRAVPPAGDSSPATFAQLFWRTWAALGYELPPVSDAHLCFVFEVMSQAQRLVVRRWAGMRDRVVLHGVRDMRTLGEVDPIAVASARGWESVRELTLDQAMDAEVWEDARKRDRRKKREGREEVDDAVTRIVRTLSRWNPLEGEGIVLCDAAWNRLKIRAPQWTALSLLNWFGDVNTNERYLLEIIRRGRRRIDRIIPHEEEEDDEQKKEEEEEEDEEKEKGEAGRGYDSEEFLEVYPEWRGTYVKVEKRYAAFVSEVETVYARLRQISDRAQFAREVKRYFFYGVMLAWRSEEEDRRKKRRDEESEEEQKDVGEERAGDKEDWKGIDGWEYYGAWGVKRLIKDMRELEETGSRAKAKGARRK